MDHQFHKYYYFSTSPLLSPFDTTTSYRSSPVSEPLSPSPSSSSDQSPAVVDESRELAIVKNHKKGTIYAYRIREHVKMEPKFSETVKGKLSVGVKIIKKGGRENIFKDVFGLIDGEKLLKASQCYLSKTSGPIAGNLFISTHKIAFCSERSFSVQSSSGDFMRAPYKLSIHVKKIKEANKSDENADNPAQKYIKIVTEDGFYLFMGFVRYEKAFNNLQRAISLCR